MTKTPRIGLWFAGASTVFFTRAFLYSSWVSRGPEVQQALHINTAQMGLLSMLYPAGGLAGILFAGALVQRFGSRNVNTAIAIVAAIALGFLGFAVDSGNFLTASICLFFMGLPMALNDFIGNMEGSAVDKESKRSLFPAIHGSFGVGMLLAASIASYLIAQKVSITTSFFVAAIFTGVLAVAAGFAFPEHKSPDVSDETKAKNKRQALAVWGEKRSLILAVLGFSFILAEGAAGIWMPIALTKGGYSGAEAASAFGVFWIVITIARLMGGFVVDLIGRFRTVLFSAIFTVAGILAFMTSELTGLQIVGICIWGLGISLGFPLVVSSMGDEVAMASPRVNMIITVVYISGIAVGPALGALGQATSIYVAFGIPLVMMMITALLSGATKPLVAK